MARDGHTVIEVHDDGLGMDEVQLEQAVGGGIGLSNVNERLRTIYGASYSLKLTSVPGRGTCASVDIPELALQERVTA
jgi:sensor histidine kinase YesM